MCCQFTHSTYSYLSKCSMARDGKILSQIYGAPDVMWLPGIGVFKNIMHRQQLNWKSLVQIEMW